MRERNGTRQRWLAGLLRGGMSAILVGIMTAKVSAATNDITAQEILKFDVGPTAQVVYEGFTPVGPDTKYTTETKYGWTEIPKYFGKTFRFPAFPDALTCDFAAPSEPLRWSSCGYQGAFEFRVDVPAGEYEVCVYSGNYNYLPSAGSGASAYDIKAKQYKLFQPEEILANGKSVFRREMISDDLVKECYHDMDTILRRGMTPWDRFIAWRFPERQFKATAADQGLVLRFVNMPVNAIMMWPSSQAEKGKAFLDKLTKTRRAKFPVTNLTPKSEGVLPPLPAGANEKGYFLFVPHYSVNVYPDTIPKPEWIKEEIQAFASLGEFESFVFSVYPLKDLEGCEVSVSDLATKDGAALPGSVVDVRVMRYHEIEQPNMTYKLTPYIPLKWTRIPIDQGINRTYWLTIHVPDDCKPGIYRGTITFKPANAPASLLRLAFRVLPIKLRPLTDRYQALYHDYGDGWPGVGPDLRVQTQRDIGFNVITTAGRMNVTYKDGQLGPLDFSDWEKQLDLYRRNGFPMVLVISQGATTPAYGATKEYFTEPEFKGAHQVKDKFSPEFEDCYKKLARAISDEFKNRNWPDIIFYDAGEAACEGPRGVRSETHLMRLLHEAGVKNTTSVSGGSTQLSLKNSVPYMYLTMVHQVTPENIQKVKDAGSRLGIYGPAETRFQRGVWFWRTGAILSCEEGGLCTEVNPYDPFDGRPEWGDIYPTPSGPAPSTHTFGKREGIDDSRYLFHLEKLIEEAEKGGSEPAKQKAAQARKVLDDLRKGINIDSTYYANTAEPPSCEELDMMRFKVAKQIMSIEEAMKP